jgi:hypothetical protein
MKSGLDSCCNVVKCQRFEQNRFIPVKIDAFIWAEGLAK